MTATETDILKIYVLLSPALVFLMALGVVWVTGWLDRREARRQAERSARTRQ